MDNTSRTSSWRNKVRKVLATWATVVMLALPLAGVILVQPQPARAQGAPVIDVASITGNLARFIKDVLSNGLKQGAAVAFKNALKVFVSQIAYDTAVWIGSGDANQKPLLYTENAGQYLLTVGNSAGGEFLNTLFDENGYGYYDLCQPGDINAQLVVSWAVAISIPDFPDIGVQLPSGQLPEVECTVTDIIGNFQEASLSADFATNIYLIFLPSNNDFGVIGSAVGEGISAIANGKEEGFINRIKNDFADQQGKISGYTATPSSAIEHQYFLSLDASSYPQTTFTGQLVADTIDIFTSTLISKLLDRLKAGLISDFTTPDITDSLSGSGSTSGGVTAAEEKFLTFTQVPLTRGTSLDILGQMASCPDEGADVTNCVIDDGFASAVTQGKTVKQALDEGLIDGSKPFGFGEGGVNITYEEGISYRSILVLKHYRIVPVGWQIAAEYLRDFGGGSSLTLQDLVDAYDQCSTTDYSPYCGLVDPDWVLVSPEGICNIQGYGQNILSTRFEDDDGINATPERNNILRAQSCVDDQSCLKEDSDGNCIAYGYCQEEKRIYRFQGDECAEQYSSCQTYEDPDGEEVSYLRDTINFNNCDAGTVGCQWYCTVYNDVNLEWQCSENGEIYSTCDSTSSTYNSTDQTCACTASDASTCDMLSGAFYCTTDSAETCTLGTEDDATSGEDSAINFNNQLAGCDEGDVGCTTYIETTTGANLIFNSSFEYFNSYNEVPDEVIRGEDELTDTTVDTFGFLSADSADPGGACDSTSGANTCIGWETTGGTYATSDDVFDGFVAAELTAPAAISYTLETGYALADRTFDLSLWVQNNGSADCEAIARLQGTLLTNPDYTGSATRNITVPAGGTWTQVEFDTYTEPSTSTDTSLSLAITQLAACTIKVDAVDLSETDDVSDYTAYGETETISMNGDRLSCDVEDIGCELYVPVGGGSDEAIPGQITNPLSDACTGADGFTDPDCSQCNGTTSDDEFVGCDFYQEQPLTNAAPIPDMAGFTTAPSATQRDGIVQRTGFYCNNSGYEGVSCYDDSDCGGTAGACVDSISIIPSTAQICSAQYVGCEEYTNLDTVAEGGEGLEFYSYIRQCVKDTPDERDSGEIQTYVTFEGSDVSGYSLRSFNLKKSNVDDGPCTNLDLYGSTAETSSADCVDTATNQQTCTSADIGVDPDCTEFIDPDSGTSYYRLASYTVSATEDCHALRNTLDGRTYFSVPSESTECPATQDLCREYKGSAGGDVFEVVNEDFEDTVWSALTGSGTVEQSSESTAAGGHSMRLTSDGGTYSLATVTDEGIVSALDEGKTYIISMWIKEIGGGGDLSVYLNSDTSTSADAQVYFVNTDINSVSGDTVTYGDEVWREYTFGPVIFPRAGEEDDELVIVWGDSTELYVDNVVLEESDSQYLIKNTADTCAGYEGCQDYTNRAGDTEYIKSFTRLCEEQFVGCEALITTQNSESPFSETYLDDNSFNATVGPTDDVIVPEDEVVAYVNDEANYCAATSVGCMELGLPEVDETTGLAESFTTGNYINDPDSYNTILCETDALWCDEFTSTNDEVVYFKDPGNKTCEYRQATDSTDFGWFVTDSDDPCPLFDENASIGQPMGAICYSGTRDGLFCSSDDDCPDNDTTDTITPHCRSDLTTDDDSNGVADSGWTGTCSAAYSGCTEYQDSNTDNLILNGSFEEDQYTFDASTYSTDTTVLASDGRPDYFEEVPFIIIPLSCDTLAQTTTRTHTGSYAMEIIQDGLFSYQDGIGCAVTNDERLEIDTSKTYTLSANFLAVNGYADSTPTTFAMGLYYFDEDGNFIPPYDYDQDGTAGDIGDYGALDVGAQAETISSDEEDTWLRYSGQIGNRLDMTWPSESNAWGANAAYVRPFVYVYTPGGSPLYIDDWTLTENSDYFYINTTVDGAPESDSNSCNGEIEIGQGCVAFRDVTNDSLTYQSVLETEQSVNSDYSVASCTIGATESESENCRKNPDTADSNVVLEVAPDRECAQWLTCKTASITTDANGNEETTCFEIDACDELSSNGLCAHHLAKTDEADLTDETDQTISSVAGATDVLDAIQNLSGYSTVGIQWADNEGNCSSGECVDGPYQGLECSGDSDCTQEVVELGYYPYEDMPQQGEDGLQGEVLDLINNGDFETVSCGGSNSSNFTLNGATISITNAFAQSRDEGQLCTLDDHCRSQETEARMEEIQSIDQQDSTTDISSSFNYSSSWCENPDSAGEDWEDWSPIMSDDLISIIDYDPTIDFDNPANGTTDTPVSGAANVASTNLDLNNVLYVEPADAGQGFMYNSLDEGTIQNGGSYVLSFKMAFVNAPSEDEGIRAILEYTETDGTQSAEYFQTLDSSGASTNYVYGDTLFKSYTMTIDVNYKPENTQSIDLYILSGSSNTPFVIDDISMLPTLGINDELNTVARECRAFPAENALMCNYTDSNGTVYAGIHGYCLEHDGLNNKKCVTWWPVDLISGDTDNRNKTTVRYNGRVPLYYCAVAKGLQDLAVCDGGQRDGAICTAGLIDTVDDDMISYADGEFDAGDNYCTGDGSAGTGQCVFGEVVYVAGESSSSEGLGAATFYGRDRHREDNNSLYRLDGAVTNENGYQSNLRSVILSTAGVGDSSGEGLFMENAANGAEQALTLSDISDIVLEFDYYGSGGPSESVSGEWPEEGWEASLVDETDGGDEPSGTTLSSNGRNVTGATIHDWDDGGGVVGKRCEWINNDIVDGDGYITYVWNSNNDTATDPSFCELNPFHIDYSNGAESALDGDLSDEDDVDEYWWHDSTSSYVQSSHFYENEQNLIAIQMTFEDSVLTSVQHILYSEIGADDVQVRLLWKYQLQETCAYIVQAVDDSGGTTTWMERIASETGYRMPNTGYTFTTGPSPFGSIQPPASGNPDVWDGDGNAGWNAGQVGGLIIQRTSADDLIAAPLACIGRCETPMCVGYDEVNASTSYQGCADDEADYATGNACDNESLTLCAGAPKYVSESGSYSSSHASEAGQVYEDDQGTEVLDINDQLFAAALVAREDLKMIFPELSDDNVYVRDYSESSGIMRNNYDSVYALSYRGSGGLWTDSDGDDIFDDMNLCSSSTRSDSDYCGIRPEVVSGSITVNGQVGNVSVSNGESVILRFATDADPEQEPISDIYIEFEGDPELGSWSAGSDEAFHDSWQAAASDDMAYSNSYSCDPNIDDTWEDTDDSDGDGYAGVCLYEIRIQVIDSWNFCSGNIDDDSYSNYRGPTCESYDKFSGYVVVSPE